MCLVWAVDLLQVQRLVPYLQARDQAVITFNIQADLRSVFSWNTKQLFVYLQAEYETPHNK